MLLFRSVAVEAARGDLVGLSNAPDQPTATHLQRSMILGCVHSCVFAAQDIIKATHTRCVRNTGRLPNW